MRIAALKTIGDQELLAAAREALDQKPLAIGQAGTPALNFQPFSDRRGQDVPAAGLGQQPAHPLGEMGGEGKPTAGIGGDLGRVARAAGHLGAHLAQPLEA